MSIWAALGLAIVATCCYQIGTVMQKIGVGRLPRVGMTIRQGATLAAFFRSPIWLGGLGVTTLGWVFFLFAVAHAPVSIVQPALGAGLALLAVFSVLILDEHLRPAEWVGIVAMIVGLVALGLSAARGPEVQAAAPGAVLLVSIGGAALLLLAARLGRSGQVLPPAVILGFASGMLIGLAALYTKAMFVTAAQGLTVLAFAVFLPVTVFANLGGLWVQQAAFQQGRALIVVAVNAVTNKIVTILGGMLALGEVLPADGALSAARLAGFAAVIAGSVLLARFGNEAAQGPVATPAAVVD